MATSTVVVAREDLTIPGAAEAQSFDTNDPEHVENQFFKTLEQNRADAVLLDLTNSRGQGVAAILRIRRRSAVPILVVCRPEDLSAPDYRRAGATACLNPPIDLMRMKEALGQSEMRPAAAGEASEAEGLRFAGYVLRPRDNRLIGPGGAEAALSEIETRVLQHLAETPGVVWPARAIAAAADGGDAGSEGHDDRSVGPVIARLRKKLARVGGGAGQRLIKTEIGRGYMVAAEAVPAWPVMPAARRA